MPTLNIESRKYTLVENVSETDRDLFLAFKPNDVGIKFLPGMFVMVRGIGQDPYATLFPKRAFSVASAPSAENLEIIAIKVPHNKPSHFIEAKIGDQFMIEGPHVSKDKFKKEFILDPLPSKVLMVGGGTGYAPLRSSIMEQRMRGATGTDIALMLSVQRLSEIPRGKELAELKGMMRGLSVTVTVTRATDEDKPDSSGLWNGEKGRINADMLRRNVPDVTERVPYVCGSLEFGNSIEAALIECGIPAEKIYRDVWG